MYSNKQKFTELKMFDIKFANHWKAIEDLKEDLEEFNTHMKHLDTWTQDNDRHLTKILPI
jgi:hypothetical protein